MNAVAALECHWIYGGLKGESKLWLIWAQEGEGGSGKTGAGVIMSGMK